MVEADPAMRAGRNAFLVLFVVLMALSLYRFFFVEAGGLLVAGLWTLGAVVFYASKYYYTREEGA